MSIIKEAFRDTSKYFIFRILTALLGVISLPILSRIFEPGDFGIYSIILTTFSMSTLVAAGWIKESILRFYHVYQKENRENQLLSIGIISVLSICAIISVIAILLNFFTSNIPPYNLFLCLSIFSLKAITFICFSYLRARQEIFRVGFIQIFQKISEVMLGMPLILLGFSNNLLAILIGWFLGELVIFFYVSNSLNLKHILKIFKIDKKIFLEMFKYGFPLILSGISGILLQYSDRYIILFFRGETETGLYAFAYQIAQRTVGFLPQLISIGVWPVIAKYSILNYEKTTKQISFFLRAYFLIVMPIIITLSLFSKELILLFGTAKYGLTYGIIPWVLSGVFIESLTWYPNIILLLKKKTYITMQVSIWVTVLNIGLNLLFIPKFSYSFAALSTCFSFGLKFLLIFFFSIRENKQFLNELLYITRFTVLTLPIIGLFIWLQPQLKALLSAPFLNTIFCLTIFLIFFIAINSLVKQQFNLKLTTAIKRLIFA